MLLNITSYLLLVACFLSANPAKQFSNRKQQCLISVSGLGQKPITITNKEKASVIHFTEIHIMGCA
jgi:hypothetical protein